uniref:FBD domain-containing protein n=1 Tax=Aegilops tauschii TaxID=37682 RepID=M8CQG5_AEGTA
MSPSARWRLSLSGCHIDLATFIPFCPRLRVLQVNTTGLIDMSNITVHSASLEQLVVEHGPDRPRRTHVSVDSPVLKQLTASFHACGNIGVSILAPMVDKVWWRCSYAKPIYGLGLWGLSEVGLNAEETHGQTDSGRDACVQLPSVHVLSLHISAVQDSVSFPNADLSFAAEIDKHMVTNFSGLDLHLSTKGHVFGAFVHVQPISSRYIFFRVTVRLTDGVTPSVDWCTKVTNIFMAYPSVECNADLKRRMTPDAYGHFINYSHKTLQSHTTLSLTPPRRPTAPPPCTQTAVHVAVATDTPQRHAAKYHQPTQLEVLGRSIVRSTCRLGMTKRSTCRSGVT